jgi:kynurenine formamidase
MATPKLCEEGLYMAHEREEWPSEEEWLTYFDKYSNWGRWGEDDSLGTLNFVTPEKVREGCAEVREGLLISCARVIEFGRSPAPEAVGEPILHFMSQVAQNAPVSGGYGSLDWIGLPLHSRYITHVDGHSHIIWNGKMYNGQPVSAVSAEFGARKGSVEPFARGVVTRGILLDIAGLHGAKWLEPSYPVGERDLVAAVERQGVNVRPGDIVMMRTGNGAYRRSSEVRNTSSRNTPGPSVRALAWLHKNNIAAFASDVPGEVHPSKYSFGSPFHAVAICAMGLWLIDNADFEELQMACEERGRWTFMVAIGGPRLKNCTGSPVNAIAIL